MQYDQTTRGCREASAADPCRPTIVAVAVVLLQVAVLAAVLAAAPARAIEMTNLYTVEVPLDPDDPNAQATAYRDALSEVLVRVTGSEAGADPETTATLFPNPARYVTQYRPGPDNTLIVSLDGESIERVLRQSGATIWGADRPLTVVWLAVDWGLGDREIVAANDPERMPSDGRSIDRNRLLRERVQTVANRRGLPIVFPLLDIEDMQQIGFIDVWGDFDEPLIAASARYEAESVLVGRIRPEDPGLPRWTWYIGEERFAWPGEPEEAINQLANSLSARDAVRGDEEIERVTLTISGISSVRSFGQVQQYLANQRAIDSIAIQSAQSDSITYEVRVRGGTERLQRILSISRLLEPADTVMRYDRDPLGMDPSGFESVPRLRYIFVPPAAAMTGQDEAGAQPAVDTEF